MPWLGWAVAAVLLLGVGGTALANGLAGGGQQGAAGYAVPGGAPGAAGYAVPGGAPGAGPGFAHRGRGRWGERAPVRGELTVPRDGGTFEQVVFARGEVTAISESSLSIRSADGTVTTFALDGDTRYRRGRDQLQRADVKVGDTALAAGPRDGQAIKARRVLLEPLRRQRGGGTPAPAPTTTLPPTTTT